MTDERIAALARVIDELTKRLEAAEASIAELKQQVGNMPIPQFMRTR